jgi:hypothetical protein
VKTPISRIAHGTLAAEEGVQIDVHVRFGVLPRPGQPHCSESRRHSELRSRGYDPLACNDPMISGIFGPAPQRRKIASRIVFR